MTFVLTAQRGGSVEELRASFRRYREYLDEHRQSFPPGAFALATSDWYFDPRDHRCPHDAWLDRVLLTEGQPPAGSRADAERRVDLRIRLLGARHDGYIEIHYPQVFHYDLGLRDVSAGHRDWRYDEFRLSEREHVIHEIEWCGPRETGRWVIEAADVEHRWIPLPHGPLSQSVTGP